MALENKSTRSSRRDARRAARPAPADTPGSYLQQLLDQQTGTTWTPAPRPAPTELGPAPYQPADPPLPPASYPNDPPMTYFQRIMDMRAHRRNAANQSDTGLMSPQLLSVVMARQTRRRSGFASTIMTSGLGLDPVRGQRKTLLGD